MSVDKPRCFGCFLRYPAVICMACRWWRECVGAGGGGADEARGEPVVKPLSVKALEKICERKASQILERERGKSG